MSSKKKKYKIHSKKSKKKEKKYKKKTIKHKIIIDSFLDKNSKIINSLFNNKDIKKMIAFFNEDDNTYTKEDNRCMCIDYDMNNNNATMENNQDYRRCKNTALNNTDFCEKHQTCPQVLQSSTLNGYEIPFNPEKWEHPYIKGSHNCYSYFLNDRQDSIKSKCDKICKKKHGESNCPKFVKGCGNLKPQPGDYALLMKEGTLKSKKRIYKCNKMEDKLKEDNPSIKTSSLFEKCPKKFYKGAMVIDDNHTFHFYRQNAKDAKWSHKPGTNSVTDIDASGKKIYIPHFANRDYSHKPNKIKYNSFCNYYCIPKNEYINTNSI